LHGDWLWDDDILVTENALVHDPSGLWKIWFDPGSMIDYQPLKMSVSWLQWQFLGNDTLGYHLTNIVLHILSALLVWRLLGKFSLRLAWLGGLLFAVHPVQVESVAWIAELKNTLSLPPFLLAMCAWIDYEEHGKRRDFFLALGLFLAAMLCKTTMVMFPVVILLYDWWKRGRIGWHDAKTSAPFFVVSLALGLATLWFLDQHTMGADAIPMGGLFSRLACAGLSLSFYFSKCFLPVGLIPIYPRWVVDPPTLLQFLPWPILGGTIYWLWTKRESWGRHALLGLGFFLINLAPFVGFNAGSYMIYTWVMDHVLYIPIIGLIGLAVAALERIEIELPVSLRFCGIGLLAVIVGFLAFGSHSYAGLYLNSETLWTYELQHQPDAYLAYNNLGVALSRSGEETNAMKEFAYALQLKPGDALIHNNLGKHLLQIGRLTEAIEQFEEALRLKPYYAEACFNLATALLQAGRLPEALAQYEQALRIKPDYVPARNNLGGALLQAGRLPEALEQYEEALRIDPDDAETHYNLGSALLQAGRLPEALEQYEEALRIDPEDAEAHNNLGMVLFQTGQMAKAREQFSMAVQLKPDDAETHNNLGLALLQTGQASDAIEQFSQALQIKPDYADARYNLANALLQSARTPEAIEQYERALQLKPDNAEAHNNLGAALLQAGRLSEAEAQFQEALRIKPDYTNARNNLTHLQAYRKTAPAKQ
jgi:Flp pilus assembly protein TadD